MTTLHIFDFDDTLVRSDSSVHVTKDDGSLLTMSSEEYAKYVSEPGDVFNFSEFDEYPVNPQIIEEVFLELQMAIAKDGKSNVVILTARSNPSPVSDFLKNNGINGIEVYATGSSNPIDKAKYVVDRINSNPEIQLVRVFEDNVKNIREIRKFVRKDGTVALQTHKISNGEISLTSNS